MQSTEGAPPPPPSTPPPPGDLESDRKPDFAENGLATVGLIVSTLGLVLAVIVIGGFIGLIGIIVSGLGLHRSRALEGRGRALALGGIALGLLSIGTAIYGFFWIQTLLDSGETTVINNIESTTSDDDYPPQETFDSIECGASNTGLLARATVTLTNRNDNDSRYAVTVRWDTEGDGPVESTFTTDTLEVDETDSFTTTELTGTAVVDSCRVVKINRPGLGFLQ